MAQDLATALAGPRPPWCSVASWKAAKALLALLRVDALAACEGVTQAEAADALELTARATVNRWRLRGWLKP